MLTQSPTCQPFLVAIKQLRLSIHTMSSPTTVCMHTSWSLGTQPQALPLAPLADCSRKQQMRLPGAPQLSVHVNQMIAKAKHHWCNSRIDKCCSLRLIQRRTARQHGLALRVLCVTVWVFSWLTMLLNSWAWQYFGCLLYTSPSPRDGLLSRMPSSA